MISVFFDPDARSEFLSTVQYYEDCQKGLGQRFCLLVESALDKIEPDHIRFVAVAHTKRKPGFWKSRM